MAAGIRCKGAEKLRLKSSRISMVSWQTDCNGEDAQYERVSTEADNDGVTGELNVSNDIPRSENLSLDLPKLAAANLQAQR